MDRVAVVCFGEAESGSEVASWLLLLWGKTSSEKEVTDYLGRLDYLSVAKFYEKEVLGQKMKT